VTVDNQPPRFFNRFDRWCYFIHSNFFILDSLGEGKHHVTVKLSGHTPDKFGILEKKKEDVEDPDQYKENAWWVGRILLTGKIED
jgi:hypothetical protein